MTTTDSRVAVYEREALAFLADKQAAPKTDLFHHLEDVVHPTPEESVIHSTYKRPDWQGRVEWGSTALVGAGWMTKDGLGTWAITDAGVQALAEYPEPQGFWAEAKRLYKENKPPPPPQRRAWLIRGSSVLGANVVPEWLLAGFCSVAASQLRPIAHDITADELKAVAEEDYDRLRYHELRAKVDEIVLFVTKVNVGDIVLTTSDQHIYVGDVTGDWTYLVSDGNRSNLRRPVDWRNVDAPIDYADLPTPLPARLQTGSTVLDLTTDLDLIDGLTPLLLDEEPEAGEATPIRPRHEHLSEPSEGLAEALHVDAAWLSEVRHLLDERRQVVFYGPPGTGKTYIARRLADDLVGPEQVKLVQFHPAYTYEDFFEGYRPVPGKEEGTISFDLRQGPLGRLVQRAREHADQAFLLVIDEINRANLAKVFGELYFLLEYRDEAVDLLYSPDDEGFTLPTNLYFIGTMNTADRSIALLDAAMRRRFAFVALDPGEEPTKSLLRRWSQAHDLDHTAADLLDRLNAAIDDPEFRIGPAYFMKSTEPDAFAAERLERIWRTSIIPLLQEHHYGEWESVERRYRLSTLLPGE